MKRTYSLACILTTTLTAMTLLLLTACGNGADEQTASGISSAVAVLTPTEGSSAQGTVFFESVEGGAVRIVAEISGLTPNSFHGFHIHEYGDLTAADGTSTGGHYNPQGHKHGTPGMGEHHAGDLGNVGADAQGNARKEMTVDFISINGSVNPVLGRGIILHAGEDDLVSQPTGAAGSRIASGVIGVANPETSF
jgi:Cu-Zn family superoxide dismutase